MQLYLYFFDFNCGHFAPSKMATVVSADSKKIGAYAESRTDETRLFLSKKQKITPVFGAKSDDLLFPLKQQSQIPD